MIKLDITSNLIVSASYDEVKQELFITFMNRDEWKYENVSKEEVNNMMSAPSQGSYFVKYIKPNFKASKQ